MCGAAPDGLHDCSFEGGDFPPTSGNMDFDQATGVFRLPSGTDTMDVDAVVHTESMGDIVLNFKSAFLTGTVGSNGNCVGARTNEVTPSTWETGGTVTGKITVPDANAVQLEPPISQSLCDLLSGGGVGGYCDDHPDPATWDNPPDTTVGADPAWQVEGNIAAIGVSIQ
jgi:hypothetical protein